MGEDESEAVTERQYSQGDPRGGGSYLALKDMYLKDVGDDVGVRDSSKFLDYFLAIEVARV
jgi:hypothetical protein